MTDQSDADRLLDGLDETQREAVTSAGAPLAILAGAGSGKTRVLTRRIAWRAATERHDPRYVLAVTFTRKAANELNLRLRQLGMRDMPTTGTFHSLAYAQLRQRWQERGISEPELLDRKLGFIARLVPRRGDNSLLLDVTSEIEWAAARALTHETYPAAATKAERNPPLPVEQIAGIIAEYTSEKLKRRVVDFDDLLRFAVRDLQADPDYAAAIRWRYRHLFVDEFQDINPIQHHLLSEWQGQSPDLTVVGDPNQAIYAWNGADASKLLWFEDQYPGAEIIRLGHNYRSTPQIVKAGHLVLPSNAQENDPPTAHRADGDAPKIRSFPSDRAEANGIARAVRDAHAPGSTWSTQAVLTRTNAQTVLIADALRSAKIPTKLRGGASLVDQQEVKQLLDTMRNSEQLLSHAVSDLRHEITATAPGEDASPADHDRHQNREALLRLASDHAAADGNISAGGFVRWLQATAKSDGVDATTDAVEITTFHAAKGLEWKIVHLAGLEKGYVPIGYADSPAQYAEEKRLLHVAITRAQQELHLSWAEERSFGERKAKRTRSPYLEALDPNSVTPMFKDTAGGRSIDRKAGIRGVKDRLVESVVDPDDPTFSALADWRRGAAREADVPAYIVFNNKTLAAIAKAMPTDIDELLDVPGIGPSKAAKYGEDVLRILADM